ncbi:MAG: bacillithiol biosynthesis cysteine-adding enzyme BshC [Terriglobia bacterium]
MTQARHLDFREVPKTSPFYLDYLYEFPKVQEFLPSPYGLDHFRHDNLSPLPEVAHRKQLCQILETQNRGWGAGEKTFENIEKLKEADCWAVVTGQQVGLFTGPAYTVYKALTAVKLAAHYNCRGVRAVPIFWMATEDHDVAEVDHCTLADPESQLVQIQYEAHSEDNLKPVGKIFFQPAIEATVQQFLNSMPESEFKAEIASRVQSSYRVGRSFASAFGELFAWLFKNYGLIVLDPLDPSLKTITIPWMEHVVSNAEALIAKMQQQSQRLIVKGYHAQVTIEPDVLGLFVEAEGKRRALIREDGGWKLRGTRQQVSSEELLKWIRKEPASFTPNVLFRPLFQDLLLPTLASVTGPSEVAYLAQVEPLYLEFGRKPPIVFPRCSFTIIERKIGKILEKYALNFSDLFLGSEAVMKKVIEKSMDPELSERFAALEQKVAQELGQLESSLKAVDSTLAEALKTTQQKVLYQLNHLHTKVIHAETRQHEVLNRQIEKAISILYPAKMLQERHLNLFYFLSRYGMDLLAQLFEEIDLNDPGHQLIRLN